MHTIIRRSACLSVCLASLSLSLSRSSSYPAKCCRGYVCHFCLLVDTASITCPVPISNEPNRWHPRARVSSSLLCAPCRAAVPFRARHAPTLPLSPLAADAAWLWLAFLPSAVKHPIPSRSPGSPSPHAGLCRSPAAMAPLP